MLFSRRLLALLLLLGLALPVRAYAEAPSKAPPGYTEAITQALSELEANNYPEALEEFQRAHKLFPNARTLRGLGMVEFELRNYQESARLLDESLRSNVRSLEGKLRSDTEDLLQRARRYIGEVHVSLKPSSATLIIDGVEADASLAWHTLEVGEHTFEARAPGHAVQRQTIRVSGTSRSELKFSLLSLSEGAPATTLKTTTQESEHTAPARSDSSPTYKKWWLWTMVAVVAVGGGAAAAVVLTRDHKQRHTAVEGNNTQGVVLQTLERF